MYTVNNRSLLRFCVTALLLIFASTSLYAQDEPVPEKVILTNEAPSLRFEHIKIEDGLKQGSANSIYQDSKGYIWIATQSGLHRYNGYDFKVYTSTPFDSTSMSSAWVWGMAESKNGDLWVTTETGGLNRLNRKTDTFTHYRHDPDDSTSISGDRLAFPFEDSKGNLWITTSGGGLNKMPAGRDGYFKRFPHVHDDSSTISSHNTFFVDEDEEGTIWVGSATGLNRIDPETDEVTRLLFDPDGPEYYGAPTNILVQYFDPNDKDHIWLGTGNGLLHFNKYDHSYERYLIEPNEGDRVNPLNFIQQIVPDPNLSNILWVSGPGTGVARFDKRTGEFTTYRHDQTDPNSLSEDYVQSLYADNTGTIWVGYTIEGISAFNPGAVNFANLKHDPNDPKSLSPGLVWGIYVDSEGTVWAGTDDGPTSNYLTQYNENQNVFKWHTFDPNDENTLLPGNYRVFAEDAKGRFWVGGNVGLNELDRKTGKVTRYRHPEERRRSALFKIKPTIDDPNKLWIASVGGIDIFDTDTKEFTPLLVAPEGEDEPFVLSMMEDKRNNLLWVATFNGLLKYDFETETSTAFRYDINDSTTISDDVLFEIVERDEEPGILWIATQTAGLNRFDTKTNTATHFNEEDGLADGHVYGILEDKSGMLWMSTNNGISSYDPDENTFRNYGLDEGLMALEYNQNAYFQDEDGVLYFGSGKGVTAFVPEELHINDIPPSVVLSDLKLFNTTVKPGTGSVLSEPLADTRSLTLKHNQNEISINYVALHYANSKNNSYAYQLVGFDKDWIQAGNQRSATYTNLSPGEYTFQVKASNADGIWNETPTTVDISILYPWYRTWWAYSLFAIMIGFVGFGIDRAQRHRISKKEAEKTALREAEFRAEAENKRREDTEQLSQIGKAITSTLSVDDIIETVYENVNALMSASVFGVGIYNKRTDRLEFPATKEEGEMLPPYFYNASDENRLAVICFKNKQDIVIGDFNTEHKKYIKEYAQPVEGKSPASILYLPLVYQNRVIGVITTQSFKKNAYDEYHINLLRNLATYAAIALDNASAYRKLNNTLSELQNMQQQLVQQEKLASLGQLTAGIAHEIKNPLNFVTNFSDLSIELLEEAKEEIEALKKSPSEGGDVKTGFDFSGIEELLNDIEVNLTKIHEHGSRADSIVKSMLQHSRGGSGKKEDVDLNALLKEYVNLTFHGMRAGKNPINVDIEYKLEDDLKPIKMIAEDFSRVVVNLCNNAFDAMREKLTADSSQPSDSPYKAKLTVITTQKDGKTVLEIQDNGPGIPDDIRNKIMQPFFTTKKGTEGTGLGLSITNDIIKAHGGVLDIQTKVNEFTRFIIYLT